uniref:Uncharacterized protein n=1 Tax=Branchiostoma floridae TaxID=7739 RepID=C3YSI5_BRAFL|eukprot:XP_002600674.1 hypothetical protein BRAFLDRAFT_67736 [Branchiostoma floridae]
MVEITVTESGVEDAPGVDCCTELITLDVEMPVLGVKLDWSNRGVLVDSVKLDGTDGVEDVVFVSSDVETDSVPFVWVIVVAWYVGIETSSVVSPTIVETTVLRSGVLFVLSIVPCVVEGEELEVTVGVDGGTKVDDPPRVTGAPVVELCITRLDVLLPVVFILSVDILETLGSVADVAIVSVRPAEVATGVDADPENGSSVFVVKTEERRAVVPAVPEGWSVWALTDGEDGDDGGFLDEGDNGDGVEPKDVLGVAVVLVAGDFVVATVDSFTPCDVDTLVPTISVDGSAVVPSENVWEKGSFVVVMLDAISDVDTVPFVFVDVGIFVTSEDLTGVVPSVVSLVNGVADLDVVMVGLSGTVSVASSTVVTNVASVVVTGTDVPDTGEEAVVVTSVVDICVNGVSVALFVFSAVEPVFSDVGTAEVVSSDIAGVALFVAPVVPGPVVDDSNMSCVVSISVTGDATSGVVTTFDVSVDKLSFGAVFPVVCICVVTGVGTVVESFVALKDAFSVVSETLVVAITVETNVAGACVDRSALSVVGKLVVSVFGAVGVDAIVVDSSGLTSVVEGTSLVEDSVLPVVEGSVVALAVDTLLASVVVSSTDVVVKTVVVTGAFVAVVTFCVDKVNSCVTTSVEIKVAASGVVIAEVSVAVGLDVTESVVIFVVLSVVWSALVAVVVIFPTVDVTDPVESSVDVSVAGLTDVAVAIDEPASVIFEVNGVVEVTSSVETTTSEVVDTTETCGSVGLVVKLSVEVSEKSVPTVTVESAKVCSVL